MVAIATQALCVAVGSVVADVVGDVVVIVVDGGRCGGALRMHNFSETQCVHVSLACCRRCAPYHRCAVQLASCVLFFVNPRTATMYPHQSAAKRWCIPTSVLPNAGRRAIKGIGRSRAPSAS